MASMVEFVEALSIVLAVGVVRGWRPALLGTGSALAVLGILVMTLGQTLVRVPLRVVQLVVGALLLLFGLRWLRKAVLRAAGVLALHDEAQAFAHEAEVLRSATAAPTGAFDKIAFTAAFKIVMLEGIEVVFIVIALGAGGRLIVPATVGALLALAAVAALGLWLHRPLARVPENSLKFGVGVMLTAFGALWVGEGIGLEWPGADWALLGLMAGFLVFALGLVALCRRLKEPAGPRTKSKAVSVPRGALLRVGGELAGLFLDDGLLAVGALVWTIAAWGLVASHAVQARLTCLLFAAGLLAVLCASAVRRAKGQAA
jgi:uncharacterized membrane protein